VQYGEGVRARATYLHKYQLLPFARTSEAMRELFGCAISPGTLHTTRGRCAAKLVGAEARIKAALRRSEVIGADETGLRVGGRSGWVHVARTEHLTHYGYDAKRGRAATDALGILPEFKGTCVRDGWYAYDEYRRCRHSLCNTHLLRELIYVTEVSPDQRQWTEPFIKLLLEIKAAAERAREAGLGQLSEEVRAKFTSRYERLVRRAERINPPPPGEKSDPMLPKFKVVRVRRRSPMWPLITRLRERREQVLRFMADLSVPFDNNGSERDLRMVKLQQKIGGCFRSGEGARQFCRLRGVISTARKQGQAVLDSIEQVLRGQPLTLTS
jgi:transposase